MKNTKLRSLVKRLEKGYADQDRVIENIIKTHSKDILDLNKQQLFAGQKSDGRSLGKYKSKWYAAFKLNLNPNGVVDLYLTGKFYSSFFIKSSKFPIQIDAKDSKTPELVKRYGKGLFGLTQESKEILARNILKVELNKFWRKIIQLR